MSNNSSHRPQNSSNSSKDEHEHEHEHEHDLVMPGFRFHPTEEELLQFYLRRKVEGKRFNVELITFLDLYRYDPWELPALAAIGEKEWFFYVPRDRKYRNGDRPNRVTTSGYWKATGADRMIRTDSSRSCIGLKKTLVFYSGKAPKGIRTSWIMNEYRLPQHDSDRHLKAEISLCRVYKRAGVEDHPCLPRSFLSRSSRGQSKPQRTDGSSSSDVTTVVGISKQAASGHPLVPSLEEESLLFGDDLQMLVNCQQQQQQQHYFGYASQLAMVVQSQQIPMTMLQPTLPINISDRLWEWNQMPEAGREYTTL